MAWAESVSATPPDYPLCYDGVKQLIAAKGDPAFSVMWAGEGAGHARSMPAAKLLEYLAAELESAS